jgi:hypothetical protein
MSLRILNRKEANEMECSICGNEIEVNCFGWDQGHNANPVNEDRCCDRCNTQVVIPARQAWMYFWTKGDVEKFDLWCEQWIEQVLSA